ncbi:MAG: hypothetical protein QOI51_775 [Nocardioidaceae bacterium]|nr:hypothetical protein [Nocardioidaceae bacterium]
MTKSRLPLLATFATAAVITVSGCGSSSGGSNAPTPPKPSHPTSAMSPGMAKSPSSQGMAGMVMVTIKNFAYQGAMTVKPGATVMVTNQDSETHTLTSDQAGMFSVNVVAGGGSARFNAPSKPGRYPYHCDFHSNMHGILVVK